MPGNAFHAAKILNVSTHPDWFGQARTISLIYLKLSTPVIRDSFGDTELRIDVILNGRTRDEDGLSPLPVGVKLPRVDIFLLQRLAFVR
jgi:hypothetical protein